MTLNITDETSPLSIVILGIADSPGEPRGINAKAREAIATGTYPSERALKRDLNDFAGALKRAGVAVLRPRNLPNVDQIFTRDVGFVVGSTFVRGRMKLPPGGRNIMESSI